MNKIQSKKNDDEDLEELISLYTTESDIRSALQEKRGEKEIKDVGILTKGYPGVQRELDLHGFAAPDAIFELEKFMSLAQQHHLRTVRIITGKGLHSKNMQSILPQEVEKRLSAYKKDRKVLAFKREKTGGSFVVYLIS